MVCHDVQGPPLSPPRMHAEVHARQLRSTSTVSSTRPPSATRERHLFGTLVYQIASSGSAQILSGAAPGPRLAQTRRSTSSPESVIVHALSRSACDSAIASV